MDDDWCEMLDGPKPKKGRPKGSVGDGVGLMKTLSGIANDVSRMYRTARLARMAMKDPLTNEPVPMGSMELQRFATVAKIIGDLRQAAQMPLVEELARKQAERDGKRGRSRMNGAHQ